MIGLGLALFVKIGFFYNLPVCVELSSDVKQKLAICSII